MTCGGRRLNVILKTLLDPGDEVIVLAPFFGEYANYISNFEGKMVVVNCCPDTFQPDLCPFRAGNHRPHQGNHPEYPEQSFGCKPIFTNPRQMAAAPAAVNRSFPAASMSFRTSRTARLSTMQHKVPFMLDYFDNAFIGYSYSKSLSLPGERIGYIAVNPKMDQLSAVLSSLNVATRILGFVNAPSLFQRWLPASSTCR